MAVEITPERLHELLRPRSVAVVGASSGSFYSRTAFDHLRDFGFLDRTYLVNPRSPEVYGQKTFASIKDIGEPVDVAFLMVPQAATEQVLSEIGEAGVRNAVVLSSGYAEAGEPGRQAQQSLVAVATKHDIAVLGPNHLGFVNFVDRVPVTSIPFDNALPGHVALLSQSGATASAMMSFAGRAAIGLSYVVTLGNEAMITASDVLEFLVDDESTRVVAIYLEEIRNPAAFERAARRAMGAGKALVVLKTGRSELAARTAAAHTGALVGDDGVIDAFFQRLGVIRVDSIEDMLVTAGLVAHTGRLERSGVGVVSISGGACNIIADRAEDFGVVLPEFDAATVGKVAEVMPDYGTVQNPLDVTGASVLDPSIFTHAIKAIGEDPAVGIVAVVNALPLGDETGTWRGQARMNAIGDGLRSIGVPSVYASQVVMPIGRAATHALETAGMGWGLAGISPLVSALRGVTAWSAALGRNETLVGELATLPEIQLPATPPRRGRWSEWQVRGLLESAGIPMVPAELVTTPEQAAAALARIGGPVAVKLVSPDVLHKSDIGAVRLDVDGEQAIRDAFAIVHDAGAATGGQVDGVLVSPMRSGGVELIVGVVRDPQWGLVLAVGFGGVFVEILQDSALSPLPVTRSEARRLVSRLRGRALLEGSRGMPVADLDAVAGVIERVSALARALGEELESLEVNPLHIRGDQVEALDALVTWREP